MALLLLLFVCIIILVDYKINYGRVTPFMLIATPYVLIILLNNSLAVNMGFYVITDRVIIMISSGLLLFWVGVLASRASIKHLNNKRLKCDTVSTSKFEHYKMRSMIGYCLLVDTIEAVRILILIRRLGWATFFSSKSEGLILTGPFGHLLLTIYPLLPILFLYWLKEKKNKYIIIAFIIGAAELFATQVKYHVLGLIMLTFIFVCIENKRYFKVGAIALVSVVILLFAGNYAVSFLASNQKVTTVFIVGHFWKYLSGSLIYDDVLFEKGIHVGVSIFYKIGSMLFAFPNMFLNAFFGARLFSNFEETPFMLVSSFGESGNIIDTIGFLFPSKGTIFALFGFAAVMIVYGFISNAVYISALRHVKTFNITTAVYLTFFCGLAFFSTFGQLIPPWEILMWSIIMPFVFSKRVRLNSWK